MSSSRVLIADYGSGNLFSIQKAIAHFGMEATISSDPDKIRLADKVILPGVGAFGSGIQELEKRGLIEAVHDFVNSGKPLLGICLGMQLLMSKSYEFGEFQGLNLVTGKVVRFQALRLSGELIKVPHVGWAKLEILENCSWDNSILQDVPDGAFVYFVHSYFVIPDDSQYILAETSYGNDRFCSVLWKDNIIGCQFHPEKSGKVGLDIYRNFLFKM